MNRVLVTGATGFVGGHLCELLARRGFIVRAALRTAQPTPGGAAEQVRVGDIGGATQWAAALEGVDVIVHAAGRAHARVGGAAEAALCRETNAAGTRQLALAAARAGVQRMLLLSSIKVNGEETPSAPFRATDKPAPVDAYGRSKLQAEEHLLAATAAGTMQAIIVRPPLVYGPGVRANFLRLMRCVERGWPLPLGAVHNRRSLVGVWNLCDLIGTLLRHPSAAGVWMVCDGEDLSTPQLIHRLARALGRRARLIPVPAAALSAAALLSGRRAQLARLCGSLRVDDTPARALLNWQPPVGVDEGLARTVAWYRAARRT